MSLSRSSELKRTPMKRKARRKGSGSTDLRAAARGQACEVCLPGVCNGDPATVVLAHLRMGHTGGMGQKPPDVCGVHACSSCHDVIDGRIRHDEPELHRYLLEALLRRLARLSREGVVVW